MGEMLHGTVLAGASAWATVGWVLLGILAGLAGLGALVVLVPLHLRAVGSVDDLELEGQVRIRWAWGLVSVRLQPPRDATLHLVGLRVWTFSLRPRDEEPADKPKRKRARGWLAWLRQYRRPGKKLLGRLLGTLQLQLTVQGALGLGDPADTARLDRLLREIARRVPAVRLQVTPDWMDERVQLDGEVRARIWLAHIGWVLAAALVRTETRRMIFAVPRAAR